VPDWLCDTVTVLLSDIALLAFEKILVLFSAGTEKLPFYNCTNFCLQLHTIFYNCTICAQLHTKNPGIATDRRRNRKALSSCGSFSSILGVKNKKS